MHLLNTRGPEPPSVEEGEKRVMNDPLSFPPGRDDAPPGRKKEMERYGY
jgi:hypothetical protein